MSTKQPYEVRRRQESERKRLQVLGMAGYCFAESGFKKTTMDEVAKRAGVSKGLVFHFFGSKQGLFKAVVEDGLNQWATLSEYRASGKSGNSLAELRSLFLASFDFAEQNPVLLLFGREDEGLATSYRQEFQRRNRRWRSRIQKTLKSGVRRNEIRDIDAARVAVIFHQMQVALLVSAAYKHSIPKYDRQTIETAIDILLRGISASPCS
jgi:AcrR family transcriptional regulator